jgi:hypothetical protein
MREISHRMVGWFMDHNIDPVLVVGIICAIVVVWEVKGIENLRTMNPSLRRIKTARLITGSIFLCYAILHALRVAP